MLNISQNQTKHNTKSLLFFFFIRRTFITYWIRIQMPVLQQQLHLYSQTACSRTSFVWSNRHVLASSFPLYRSKYGSWDPIPKIPCPLLLFGSPGQKTWCLPAMKELIGMRANKKKVCCRVYAFSLIEKTLFSSSYDS